MGKQRFESEKNTQSYFRDAKSILDGDGFVGVHSVTMLEKLHLYYCVFIKCCAINNEKAVQKEWELCHP